MATLPFNWGQYLGAGDETSGARDSTFTTDEGWQQALNWVKQFDPSAAIRDTMLPSGEAGKYLAFNNALLPQNAMGGHGIENATNLAGLRDANRYTGPAAQDANLGNIGYSPLAMRQLSDRGTWLDVVGPMLVGGLAGLGGGGLGFIGNALTKAPNVLSSFAGMLGGGPSTMSPQQMMILRLLAARSRMGGGG